MLPQIIYIELVGVVLVHVEHRWNNSVYQKLCNLRTVPPPHCAAHKALLMEVEGMVDLLYGYAPAVFIIGCHLRHCDLGSYANSDTSTTLYSRCLHVLIRLTLG